jgi:DNA-binding PadR family transcriptional regulator
MTPGSVALTLAGVLFGGWLGRRILAARAYRQQRLILSLLSEHGDMLGADIYDRCAGSIGRGTVYVLLDGLETAGLVVSRLAYQPARPGEYQGPTMHRRVYRLTAGGALVAKGLAEGLEAKP